MNLILGGNGMLGRAFLEFYDTSAISITRKDCDFKDFNKLSSILDKYKFNVLINCAAIIDITYIEDNEDDSFKINALLPYFLANYCNQKKIRLVHISTDHYFNDNQKIHDEDSFVNIVNKYAEQKYVAERLVLGVSKNCLAIRTSILGFKDFNGSTLLEWILLSIKNEKKVNGFYDAYTSSLDVQSFCYYLNKLIDLNVHGLFNIGSKNPYYKYELIELIVKNLKKDNIVNKVKLHKSSIKSMKVKRANNCGLDCSKYEKFTNLELPNLSQIIENLKIKEKYYEI